MLVAVHSTKVGSVPVVDVDGRPLHCFEISKDAVTKVYLGERVDEATAALVAHDYPDVSVCRAVLDQMTSEINFRPMT